ncbi:hypothetical protein NSK11_contig00198-0005 [Nocardia seriolae]|uniref:Uncharacterized protein n=1 Tax=Nocardia seriolae TaxID=37332 RepID=A0ABC9Z624_9NOCA|nr:hypothetical protein NSERKGN1266_71350 [Nocardia seriolae]BEK93095.1 hypothetical protein NSER024013_10010 [Nocardia seriolae]GAM51041.1 hypothetical protein NS07_v2contig00197-0005 [Nocardia seriolae]GAP32988.1 hypothetical protein NSK11_contig00198-0005 [Nocardia seriolae]GEM27872.1 hypothetical protein NS2_61110 [Nocardia seriolae NBRC 15557]
MRARLARYAALAAAAAALGLGVGAIVSGSPTAAAQGYVPCEQWQAMHPGWPCIDTPTVPPVPPGGPPTVSTPPPLPSQSPGIPSQPGNGGGIGAGALTPPPIPPGNGTPIVPVPGAETPVLPGNQAPAPPIPPRAPENSPVPPPPANQTPDPSNSEPAPARTPAPTPAATSTPVPAHVEADAPSIPARGGDGRIPWLLLAGAAAFVAPALRLRGGGGGSAQQLTITKPWDGGQQTFILMDDPSAPHEYRFPQDVPPGGQLRKNPDGSVDVLDADGQMVSHTNPPWAYDALGRLVRTWYEVDGDTIVQHIEPDPDNVFPILADPDTVPSCSITDDGHGGTITSSNQPGGGVFTTHDDGHGGVSTAQSVPVPDSGGTVDTTIRNPDGTTSQMRSTPDGNGGITTWTANPDGSHSVRYPDGELYVVPPGGDTDAPAPITAQVSPDSTTVDTVVHNDDGTTSSAHSHLGAGNYIGTDITNPDGSHTQVTTGPGRLDGQPVSIITQPDGTRVVREPDGTLVPIDRYGDALDGPNYWNQFDPETGTWRSDPITHRGPILTNPNGTSTQQWFYRGPDGDERSATAMFDSHGNLTFLQSSDYTGATIVKFETIDGVTRLVGTTKMDAGNVEDKASDVFNAAMMVTGVGELGWTAGRLIGTELIARELAAQGMSQAEILLVTSQLAKSDPQFLIGTGQSAAGLDGAGAAAGIPASSYGAGVGLSEQLTFEEAASIFNVDGTLTSAIVGESRLIIPGENLGNPGLIEQLTADGSKIEDWAKYSTPTARSPSGDFQVHFYRNGKTGDIYYGGDYKSKFN